MPTSNNHHKRAAFAALVEAEAHLRCLIAGLKEVELEQDIYDELESCRRAVEDVQTLLRDIVGTPAERLPESTDNLNRETVTR